jgi:GNAT superfamily N-acetyltransferase
MIIRPFKPEYAQACCDVINGCVTAMQGLNDAARFHIIAKNVPADLSADLQTGYTLVAELHGHIVAVGSLADDGEIRHVYVLPDVQHQGVGKALMDKLEMAARTWGHQQVHLEAAQGSVEFYEGLGYAVVGNARQEIGTAIFEYVKMTKVITETAGV